MRENRTSGSEGGTRTAAVLPVQEAQTNELLPTPIALPVCDRRFTGVGGS